MGFSCETESGCKKEQRNKNNTALMHPEPITLGAQRGSWSRRKSRRYSHRCTRKIKMCITLHCVHKYTQRERRTCESDLDNTPAVVNNLDFNSPIASAFCFTAALDLESSLLAGRRKICPKCISLRAIDFLRLRSSRQEPEKNHHNNNMRE